jgi:tetratricopeptide (TPR) repeat protein
MGDDYMHRHFDRVVLRRVRRGQLSLSVGFAHALEHLAEICPLCRAEIEALELEEIGDRLSSVGVPAREAVAAQWAAAHRDLIQLDGLADGVARRLAIERARNRMRSRLLVELLLERAQERRQAGDQAGCLADCELAEAVARRVPDEQAGVGGSRDLVVFARAHLANAHRVAGSPETADRIFSALLPHLVGMTEPTMEAQVSTLAASLRIVQGRFDEALGLLQRAVSVYSLIDDTHSQGKVLTKAATALFLRGDLAHAIKTGRTAISHLDPCEHKDFLCAVHNLAHYLEASGEILEAYELLEQHAELYRQFPGDALFQGRLIWLHARLLERRRELGPAETAFRQTRLHFLEHGMAYSAALVTLDLAKLLLDRHRFSEVQALAEQSADVLATGALHGYAREAFDLFRQAALAEALSVAELVRIADYLRRAERDPALRFTGVS